MKADNSFLKALNNIEHGIVKMRNHAEATRWFYEKGDYQAAYERAMTLEELSERTVLMTRALPAYSGSPQATTDVSDILVKCIPVEIGYTAEGWFSIRFPALLPKKNAGSADYVRAFLYPAMRGFFMKQPPVRYEDCVLVYRHVYAYTRPERQKRDHDNIEINMVSDIVAMYVMADDGPAVCSHYYCSAAGMKDRTEVYVIPKKEFPVWLITEKAMPQEGVTLYEERLL